MNQSILSFIKLVEDFKPLYDLSDKVWVFWFKDRKIWTRLQIQKVLKTYYFFDGRDSYSFPPDEGRNRTETLEELLKKWLPALRHWHFKVSKDPLGAQAELFESLPFEKRMGMIHRRNLLRLVPDVLPFRTFFSKKDFDTLISLLRYNKNETQDSFRLTDYFRYCEIAYQANPKTFKDRDFKKGLSGKEYYQKYADGRDGGLLKIAPLSEEAFDKWYHSDEHQGCHPWEIYRGGNSTHIDLYVTKLDNKKWQVGISAFSSSRMVEACKIALAFHYAKLPFKVVDASSYLHRLLETDWIGIVPENESLAYAWHSFPREFHVADSIHFSFLLEGVTPAARRTQLKRQCGKIINWLHEPISAWLNDSRNDR